LSPGANVQAEALDLAFPGRIQRRLEFDIERTRADPTPVHRAQHLDLAHGIEPEAAWDMVAHQVDDARHRLLQILRRHVVEIAQFFGPRQVRRLAAVDPVGAHSRISVPFAARMRRIAFTRVVLPTPGPPVITRTLERSASRTASA